MMKKLACHQTYFFPYIGYFSVLNRADIFVHADSFQYIRKGWVNRNRIIGENGEVKYIGVPVKKAVRETPANEIEIDYSQDWEKKLIDQLGYYKKKAPYYSRVLELLGDVFSTKYSNIAQLAISSTESVMDYLGIEKEIHLLSELDMSAYDNIEADEWGLRICQAFDGVDTYVNAPGGKEFFDVTKYENAGIKIEFLKNRLKPYIQRNGQFIPGLSVLDVMMFNTPEEIKQMLEDYEII